LLLNAGQAKALAWRKSDGRDAQRIPVSAEVRQLPGMMRHGVSLLEQ
jgi:hypothetical protein